MSTLVVFRPADPTDSGGWSIGSSYRGLVEDEVNRRTAVRVVDLGGPAATRKQLAQTLRHLSDVVTAGELTLVFLGHGAEPGDEYYPNLLGRDGPILDREIARLLGSTKLYLIACFSLPAAGWLADAGWNGSAVCFDGFVAVAESGDPAQDIIAMPLLRPLRDYTEGLVAWGALARHAKTQTLSGPPTVAAISAMNLSQMSLYSPPGAAG